MSTGTWVAGKARLEKENDRVKGQERGKPLPKRRKDKPR